MSQHVTRAACWPVADRVCGSCRLDDDEAARSQRELQERGVSAAAAANPLSLSKLFYSGGLSTELNPNLHPGLLSNLLNSSVQFPSMSGDLPPGITTSAAVDARAPGSASPGGSPGAAAMEVDAA